MAARERQRTDGNDDDRRETPLDHRCATGQEASASRRPEPVFSEMACFYQNAENQQGQSSQNVKNLWKLHPIDLNDPTADAQQQPQYFTRGAYSVANMEYSNQNVNESGPRAFSQDDRRYRKHDFRGHHDRPHSSRRWIPRKRGSYNYGYDRTYDQTPYQRRQPYHQYDQRRYSGPNQSESEQVPDGIFPSRSSRERPSHRRTPTSRKKRHSEGRANTQPVSSAALGPSATSSVSAESVIPTSGENQTEQLAQNSEHRSQSASVHENVSNQQASSSAVPGPISSMNRPSPDEKTAKKQSKQSLQKSENVSKTKIAEGRKLIQLVSEHPHLYDPKDSAYRDTNKKQESWTTIGKTLGMTGNACQSNWRSMRIRNNKINRLITLGDHVPEEDSQFVKDMSFVPFTQSSSQEENLTRRENRDSDELLVAYFAARLRQLSPNLKRSFRSKILGILAEFSTAV